MTAAGTRARRSSFAMVASSVALGTHRDRAVRIPVDTHRPGPAADFAILHQHVFARFEIRRLDFDAARLAAERTFDRKARFHSGP